MSEHRAFREHQEYKLQILYKRLVVKDEALACHLLLRCSIVLIRAATTLYVIAQRCEQHPSIDPPSVGQQSPSSPSARQAAFALHAAVVCHGGPGVGETPDEGETGTGDGAGGKVCVTPAWQPQQSGTVSHEFAGTWLHQLLQVHATLRLRLGHSDTNLSKCKLSVRSNPHMMESI